MTNNERAAQCLIEAAQLLTEGAQADAYKAKKREERLSKYEDEKHRRMNVEYSKDGRSKVYHAQTGSLMDYDSKEGRIVSKAEKNGLSKNEALKHEEKMRDIAHKASEITRRESNRRDQIAKASGKVYDKDFDSEYQSVMDATNRHMRRHKSQNESIEDDGYIDYLLYEAQELLDDKDNEIDNCVEKYIAKNKDKFKTGDAALKEFKEVEDTLNVDGAFKFETKEIAGVPTFYMYSAKSNTLLQVYFGIKAEAGHIELSVKELMDQCK